MAQLHETKFCFKFNPHQTPMLLRILFQKQNNGDLLECVTKDVSYYMYGNLCLFYIYHGISKSFIHNDYNLLMYRLA